MLELPSTGAGIVWLTDFIRHPGPVGLKVTLGQDLIIDDPAGTMVLMERQRVGVGNYVRLGVRIHHDEALVPGTYVFWLSADEMEGNRLVNVPSSPFSIDKRTTPVTRITVVNTSPPVTLPGNQLIFWKDVTGLAGGGSTNLDGVPTDDLPFGTVVTLIIRDPGDGSESIQDWKLYQMAPGDVDDPTHGVVLPDDNNPVTNPRIWKRLR